MPALKPINTPKKELDFVGLPILSSVLDSTIWANLMYKGLFINNTNVLRLDVLVELNSCFDDMVECNDCMV